jgi:hypothetical protein
MTSTGLVYEPAAETEHEHGVIFFFKKEAQLEKQNEVADTETWSKEPWVVPPHDLLLRA